MAEMPIPDALLAALAAALVDQVTDAVEERLANRHEPYIGAREAAEYLSCGLPRIRALTSAGRIPVHRDGSRVLFRRSELDAWIENGGGIRP
jgi:excisionase family DNA binding protein